MENKWKVVLMSIVAILGVILLGVFIVQNSVNKAISLEETVSSSQSDIEVQEKRREDLIFNLVDCVKQYDKHEYETIMDTVKARNNNSDKSIQEVTTMINATAENYPELKSNENYKELMNELSTTENMIANYRSNYNSTIKDYNRYIKKFPTRIFLNMTGYEAQNYKYLEYNAPSDSPQDLFK